MSRHVLFAFILAALALMSESAAAYFGPGAGITMLAALWGVVLAVVLAIGAILFWPIRALLRKRKAKSAPAGGGAEATTANREPTEADPAS